MRFIYADAGLRTNSGHHANACRLTLRELRSRGVETSVYASARIEDELRRELGATALFRHSPYANTDGDPICGWLNAFDLGTRAMREDLSRLPALGPDDLLFVGTVSPPLLMGIVAWLAALQPAARPHVVLDLGTDSGLERDPYSKDETVSPRDPRLDARAAFYRFAAARIPKDVAGRISMFYFDRLHAEAFSRLMNFPVRFMPMFYEAYGAPKNRAGKKNLTVAVLGHQQPYKGFHLVPDVARKLLAARSNVRLLVHNSNRDSLQAQQQAVRETAAADPRIEIDERAGTQSDWAALIDRTDIILCPYDPRHYSLMPSGLASEAAANAVPIVGPAGTAIDRFVREHGGFGTAFEAWTADSIAAATVKAIDDFDRYAGLAHSAAKRWAENGGPRRAVDLILACARQAT
jgi:glycosyltransferase involved in cell wall biosynthesis